MKINEELNKWRDTLVSLIRKLNTAKIAIPPKLIYRFNAIPISIVALVFLVYDFSSFTEI